MMLQTYTWIMNFVRVLLVHDAADLRIGESPSICPFLKNNGPDFGAEGSLFFRNGQIR